MKFSEKLLLLIGYSITQPLTHFFATFSFADALSPSIPSLGYSFPCPNSAPLRFEAAAAAASHQFRRPWTRRFFFGFPPFNLQPNHFPTFLSLITPATKLSWVLAFGFVLVSLSPHSDGRVNLGSRHIDLAASIFRL